MKAKKLIAGLLILSVTATTACIDENSVFAPIKESSEASVSDSVDYS